MSLLEGNGVLVFGGGSGAAPVRGVIEYVHKNREKFGSVNLFYGFRGEKDILFGEDWENWQNNDMYIDLALSEDHNHPTAVSGFVTHLMDDALALQDNSNKVAFVCGPPIMIDCVQAMLESLGVPEEMIAFDKFG